MMGPSYEKQAPQTTNKDTTYQILKKVAKFIISFSVFTFFFSNPSWLSLFLHSFISHVSSFPSQLLSHINDKNYIFLLFNGILVILAKSSSRMISENSDTLQAPEVFTTMISENSDTLQPPELFTTTNEVPPAPETEEEREIPVSGDAELIEKEPEEEENNEFMMEMIKKEPEEEENNEFMVEMVKKEPEEEENDEFMVEEERENEEEENSCVEDEESVNEYCVEEAKDQAEEESIARMSTEELNRKFEEFIRKMKEDIRIEAQQQLVMV